MEINIQMEGENYYSEDTMKSLKVSAWHKIVLDKCKLTNFFFILLSTLQVRFLLSYIFSLLNCALSFQLKEVLLKIF